MTTTKELGAKMALLEKEMSKKVLSEDDLQAIKNDLINTLSSSINQISTDIEKSVSNSLINWVAQRLIIIILSSFVLIGSMSYYFLSQNNDIQNLKIENQKVNNECQNKINDFTFIKKIELKESKK